MALSSGSVPGGTGSAVVRGPGYMGRPPQTEPETLTSTADNIDSQPETEGGFLLFIALNKISLCSSLI